MFRNMLTFTFLVATFALFEAAHIPSEELGNQKQNVSAYDLLALRYQITNNEADFNNARHDCKRNHEKGDIVQLRNLEEKENLEIYLDGLGSNVRDYWLGAICNVDLGKFVWIGDVDTPIDEEVFKSCDNHCDAENERLIGSMKTSKLQLSVDLGNSLHRAACEQPPQQP